MELSNELLAEYAREVTYDDLPPAVVERTKRFVLDCIGCGIGGYTGDATKILRKLYGNRDSTDAGATVLGSGKRVPVEYATLLNSAMIRYLDFNDTYVTADSGGHPSDNIGALLTVAEHEGATGKELITAIVVAYEIYCRGVDTAACMSNGFDFGTWGSLSATVAIGKLMGFTDAEYVNAVGISGTSNVCLKARAHSRGITQMWKGIGGPYVNHNAVQACQLARAGVTAPQDVFGRGDDESGVDSGGFFDVIAGDVIEFDGLGGWTDEEYRILRSAIKPYPVEYYINPAITVALELRQETNVDPESIDSIDIRTFDRAVEGAATPEKWSKDLTREHADHSMPFAVAVAFFDGAVTPRQFTADRRTDERIHALMDKITVTEDDGLNEYRTTHPQSVPLVFRLEANGETHEVRTNDHLGHPDDPMTDEQLEEKVIELARGYLTEGQTETVIDCCYDLENLDTIGPLFDELVV